HDREPEHHDKPQGCVCDGCRPTAGPPGDLRPRRRLRQDGKRDHQLRHDRGAPIHPARIPGGLYRHVNGTATAVDPTGVLEDNYVVDSVLLTHDVEVSFTSAERFTGDFDAKLTAFGSIPAGSLKVIYRRMDDRTIVAKVRGEKA